MSKIYNLTNNEECINVIINGDKAILTIQTSEICEIRELDVQSIPLNKQLNKVTLKLGGKDYQLMLLNEEMMTQ